MIIYGKNYDELRAFRVRSRVSAGASKSADRLGPHIDFLVIEFNYKIRDLVYGIGELPREYFAIHVSEVDKKTMTHDITLAFAPFDRESAISVVLIDDKELKPHVLPKNMKRLEVAQLKGPIFGSPRDQAEPIKHTNRVYEPWGFDLSTGNFVWKEVK